MSSGNSELWDLLNHFLNCMERMEFLTLKENRRIDGIGLRSMADRIRWTHEKK